MRGAVRSTLSFGASGGVWCGEKRQDDEREERRERRDGDREACYGKRGLAVKAIECAPRRSRGVETNAFDLMHYTRQIFTQKLR